MSRPSHRLLVAGLCLALAAPALAGNVYQWKDARGVTHYSDSPPPKGVYRDRAFSDTTPATPADLAKGNPADSSQCAQYRTNLARLRATGEVALDSNRDGKPDGVLGAEARARQIGLVEAAIRTDCPGSAG